MPRKVTLAQLAFDHRLSLSEVIRIARRLGVRDVSPTDFVPPDIAEAILTHPLDIQAPLRPELPPFRRKTPFEEEYDDNATYRRARRKTKQDLDILPLDVSNRAFERLRDIEKRLRVQIARTPSTHPGWSEVAPLPPELPKYSERTAISELADTVATLLEAAASLDIPADAITTDFDEALQILETAEAETLYAPPSPDLYIPQGLIAVSDSLLALLAREPALLRELSPRRFEELIAELFRREGFYVELTKQTRDGGKDIIAVSHKMNVLTKYVIECKRFAAEHSVGLALVQRLLGVKVATSANKAILATTSTYTRDARVFAADHFWDLDLKDFDDIRNWLSRYGKR